MLCASATPAEILCAGPGVVSMDLGVFRRFPLTERFTLEFRTEAFNFTNTPHFANPSANVNSADSCGAERERRPAADPFGLRLSW